MATTLTTSSQFSINWADAGKGLIMAILTPIVFSLLSTISSGTLAVNWHNLLILALSAGLGYIAKNFFTPSAIVVKDAPQSQVDAIKDGELKVTLTQNR